MPGSLLHPSHPQNVALFNIRFALLLLLPLLETGKQVLQNLPQDIAILDTMSSKPTSQPPKRARTSVKGPQDVAEEWAQVNSLIERRRLQNRLSQKNYRLKSFPRFYHELEC